MPDQKEPNQLTHGQRAVGITFNPGKLETVESIKRLCAAAIDEIHGQREQLKDTLKARQDGTDTDEINEAIEQFNLAIRRMQEGQMWAVKAATWLLNK